jgi:hypothetical protein
VRRGYPALHVLSIKWIKSSSEVVRKHLEEFAAGLDLLEEAADLRFVRELEARLERGEETVHDWEQIQAELDALPD